MKAVAALLAVAAVSLVAALPAAAKEGVKATLTSRIPVDAAPGTELDVAWTLAFTENGQRHPFGAGGVFVRLASATGGKAETGEARPSGGDFTATVTVPEGGIGDVQIGLHAFRSNPSGTADMIFPITNDPLPGPARVAFSGSDDASGGTNVWLAAALAAALLAMGAIAVGVARRRRPLEAH
jgi:hypothetical protein